MYSIKYLSVRTGVYKSQFKGQDICVYATYVFFINKLTLRFNCHTDEEYFLLSKMMLFSDQNP